MARAQGRAGWGVFRDICQRGHKVRAVGLKNSYARLDSGACRGLCRAASGPCLPLRDRTGSWTADALRAWAALRMEG